MSFDDANRAPMIMAQEWCLVAIASIAVTVRLYARLCVTRTPGWDDVFIVLALATSAIVNIGDTIGVSYGYGRHLKAIAPADRPNAQKWIYVGMMINFPCLFFMRTSVMLFVLRLLPKTKRWPVRLIYFAMALNVVITIIGLVMMGTRCIPFEGLYINNIGAKCSSPSFITTALIVNASLSCLIDFITAAVPMLLLYGLKIKKQTKVMMYIALASGLLTAALSIGRAITIVHPLTQIDITWNQMPCCLIGHYEEKLGIIIACLPGIRQLVIAVRHSGKSALRPIFSKRSETTTQISKASDTKFSLTENLKNKIGFRESRHLGSLRVSKTYSTAEKPPSVAEGFVEESKSAPGSRLGCSSETKAILKPSLQGTAKQPDETITSEEEEEESEGFAIPWDYRTSFA
ncbi:MAG: hypothetical protein M1828_004998 [Chrysothrix sp. TS-e1954]|nr:MAG: hypothetical protein M1828_004998 [Chrysothrix sp. TS-e1954]